MTTTSNSHEFFRPELAEKYAATRPSYPPKIAERIVEFLKEKVPGPHSLVVDVACGTGQGTRILADYFEKVIGTDISEHQIDQAKKTEKLPNISYRLSRGETLPIESGTVDVVTVASALQWLQLDKFFVEVDRILKPGGVLAVYSLREVEIRENNNGSSKATKLIEKFYKDTLYENFPASYLTPDLVKTHYRCLTMPYEETKRDDSIYNERTITVQFLIDLFASFSPMKEIIRKDPLDGPKVLDNLKAKIMDILHADENTEVDIAIPLYLVMARKPLET